ncbi:MAG: four helix bundle protein, partial [Synergistaceae bacterium]|nr:four helix bundle protein [Synergistaceae bacterium]
MEPTTIFRFQKLDIYQLAKNMVKDAYRLIKKFPSDEKFALIPQICRAAISVPSNIAEGVSRSSKREQIHFLNIAYASLMEVICQVEISRDLDYIDDNQLKAFILSARDLSVRMNNFM